MRWMQSYQGRYDCMYVYRTKPQVVRDYSALLYFMQVQLMLMLSLQGSAFAAKTRTLHCCISG